MLHMLRRPKKVRDVSVPAPCVAPCTDVANALSPAPNARCVAFLRRFLATDSSQFEQLILASYLRHSNGDHRLDKLTREYNSAEVTAGLRQAHMDIFVGWLGMPLSEQQVDIRAYMADPDDRTRMLASLAETARAAIPPEVKPHEVQLFTLDLEMIQSGLEGGAPETSGSRRMDRTEFPWFTPSLTPAHKLPH